MTAHEKDIQRDVEILREFAGLYCRKHHAPRGSQDAAALCPVCREVLYYAIDRRQRCPMDPKPTCRKCPVHCYREPYRTQIREMMKFGALHTLKTGRVDKLVRHAFSKFMTKKTRTE
jgi:hypothetical protein